MKITDSKYLFTSGKCILCVVLLLFLVAGGCNEPAEPDHIYRVTLQTTAKTPSSPLLFSHFVEIGFGYQIQPMMAEKFFNRSFEPIPPYNGKTKNSFGLLLPEGRYIDDWSGEAWYHSGYAHDNWYVTPGKPGNPAIISDDLTYFVTESPDIDVKMELRDKDGIHGEQYVRIVNNEINGWGGIAQDGKFFQTDISCHFSGYLRSVSGNDTVEIRLTTGEDPDTPFFSKRVRLNNEFKKYEYDIPYTRPDGMVTFTLLIGPGAVVEADAFSLIPDDHFYGWKRATLDVMRQLNPGLIRFPGGCFASFYNWKDAIGEKDSRVPQPSWFWGGLNDNDFGTEEFAMLCNEIGAEMMMCVNLCLPQKRKYLNSKQNAWQYINYDLPQFADAEQGIRDAADWVAYCNLEEGTHPMADLRVRNGFKKPFGARYWEMDNETARWLNAEEYANEVVRYSKAMKAVDPTIKIGMVTYDYGEGVPLMLEIAGKHIDFFADRDDGGEGRLEGMIALLNEYNSRNSTDIRYCNTEWQVHPYSAPNPKEEVPEPFLYGHKTKIKRAMVLGTWHCGLRAAGFLMHWQRQGNMVDFVNYNNLANTHGQAVIETPKEGAYLTAPGKLYELISRSPGRYPLVIEDYEAKRNDMIQGQAVYSLTKDTLVIHALNRTDTAQTVMFDLSRLGTQYKMMSVTMLDADDIFARTRIDMPDEIRRSDRTQRVRSDKIALASPPRSYIQAVLTRSK